MIPLIDLTIRKDLTKTIKENVLKVIDSQSYILGDQLSAFEKSFAKVNKVKEAIGVGNGTDALRLSLRSLGITKGDKVITVSLTSPFTAIAIVEEGAIPIFCDVDPKTWTLDPDYLERHIDKKTKAIIPVHLFGNPAEMRAIKKIAKGYNLKIIEDACQAHLAQIDEIPVGNWSDAAAFSFYPTKNLGAMGDAGAIVTNNKELAKHIKILRHGGQTKRFWHVYKGLNSRLDEIQAAILNIKLKFLKSNNRKRAIIAQRYKKELDNLPLSFQGSIKGGKSVNHLFVVRTDKRDNLHTFLFKKGIQTGVYYPHPTQLQPAFKKFTKIPLPITEKLTKELLGLPLYPTLSENDQYTVIKEIKRFFKS